MPSRWSGISVSFCCQPSASSLSLRSSPCCWSSPLVRIPVFLLGVLLLGGAVLYPRLLVEQTRRSLENQLHLLITHMTVLSTTNIDRVAVFRTLAREEEYGELATEMNRIVQLVDAWNRASTTPVAPGAGRSRAARSDFLDRLAYTLGAGQDRRLPPDRTGADHPELLDGVRELARQPRGHEGPLPLDDSVDDVRHHQRHRAPHPDGDRRDDDHRRGHRAVRLRAVGLLLRHPLDVPVRPGVVPPSRVPVAD